MKKKNILAIAPHADDVEIAMGGTIARYVDEGHDVTIVTAIIPQEDSKGKVDKFMTDNRLNEQKNAAAVLGANFAAAVALSKSSLLLIPTTLAILPR